MGFDDTFDWYLGFFYGMTYYQDFQVVVEELMEGSWKKMPTDLQTKIVEAYLEGTHHEDNYYYHEKRKKIYERGYDPDEEEEEK